MKILLAIVIALTWPAWLLGFLFEIAYQWFLIGRDTADRTTIKAFNDQHQ